MPRKVREIRADLRRAGFVNRGGKGSHTNWLHAWLPGTLVTVAGNDGDDATHYNERDLRNALAALAAERELRARQGKEQ